MKFEIGQAYLVRWHDASFSDRQGDGQDPEVGVECESLGFAVKATRAGVRFAMERDADPESREYRFFMEIPRRMILKATPVRWTK